MSQYVLRTSSFLCLNMYYVPRVSFVETYYAIYVLVLLLLPRTRILSTFNFHQGLKLTASMSGISSNKCGI